MLHATFMYKIYLKKKRDVDQLIQVDQITRQEIWMNEMVYINHQKWNEYNTTINDLNEVTLKDFQFKLNNKILATKTFLHKIRKNEDNLCPYCKREPETNIKNVHSFLYTLFNEGETHLANIKLFYHVALSSYTKNTFT